MLKDKFEVLFEGMDDKWLDANPSRRRMYNEIKTMLTKGLSDEAIIQKMSTGKGMGGSIYAQMSKDMIKTIRGIQEKASPEQEMKWGKEIEKEHGTVSPSTNVTDDDPVMTKKIAQAHVNEIPDYYTRLRELEKQGKAALKKKLSERILGEVNQEKKGCPICAGQDIGSVDLGKDVNGPFRSKTTCGSDECEKEYNIRKATGNLKSEAEKPCKCCDGKGYLEDRDESGKYQIECPECKGKKDEATHAEIPFDTFDKRLDEELWPGRADYYKKLWAVASQGIYDVNAVVKMSFLKNDQQKLEEIGIIVDRTMNETRRIMDEKS